MGHTAGKSVSDGSPSDIGSGRRAPPDVLTRYTARIQEELRAVVDGESPEPEGCASSGSGSSLYGMMRYHLGWRNVRGGPEQAPSGKALRPTLCLLACEACCGDPAPAMPAAAAVELLHNFSLIHDDIQDDDRERRHRPTVWSIWGKPQAINAGTAMHVLVGVAARRLLQGGCGPDRLVAVSSILDRATLTLLEGQHMDIGFEQRTELGAGEYLEMIEKKTASLISCSLRLGALVGTGDRESGDRLVEGLAEFGRCLGMAFQIRDDMLGIWGEEKLTGKPLAGDIRKRKKSFPVVELLGSPDKPGRGRLIELYARETLQEEEVAEIVDLLEEAGARRTCQRRVDEYTRQAMEVLSSLPLPERSGEDLAEVLLFLSRRTS